MSTVMVLTKIFLLKLEHHIKQIVFFNLISNPFLSVACVITQTRSGAFSCTENRTGSSKLMNNGKCK